MIKELFLHRPRIRKITPKTPTNTDAIAKVVNRNNIKKLLDQISCNLLNVNISIIHLKEKLKFIQKPFIKINGMLREINF
jgi:hypothetical protein